MDWKNATQEQRRRHLDGERRRRIERKARRTAEQAAALSEQRRAARQRRNQRAEAQQVARKYVRDGNGYFYTWATALKARAKTLGVPCDIDASWLRANMPTHCPVLGIELKRRLTRGDNAHTAPTVDRLDPALGYVRGNIHIISRRANNIKSDATVDEIKRVAQWVETMTQKQ